MEGVPGISVCNLDSKEPTPEGHPPPPRPPVPLPAPSHSLRPPATTPRLPSGSHSKSSRKFLPIQPGPSGRPPPWLMGSVAICVRAGRSCAPLQSPQGLSLSCGQFLTSSWWRHRLQKGGFQRESREEGNEKGQVGQVYGVRGRLDFGVVNAPPLSTEIVVIEL